MNLTLIYPMFALVVLSFIVGLLVVRTRWRAVRTGQVSIKYFKTMSTGEQLPDFAVRAGRQFMNLFEVPVLFYAGCIVAMVIPIYGIAVQFFAWLFVFARIAQAAINLGSNKVAPRMSMFCLGFGAMMGLWLTIVVKVTLLMSGAFAVGTGD